MRLSSEAGRKHAAGRSERLCEPFAARRRPVHSADTMPDPIELFDRRLLRCRRDRAASTLAEHDFLLREVADRLLDRLLDIKRRFPLALDLGCHTGGYGPSPGGPGGIETVVRCELSPAMARRAPPPALAADEELLPFANDRFDLVYSNLSLHWVNDLPGTLVQINAALKPDGLFLAALLGGDTLIELREALTMAEIEILGGASPRISPFVDLRDAGTLLQRAGFALPVVDADRITVTYGDPIGLMTDLRGMGESNAVVERLRRPTRRSVLQRAAEIYRRRHGDGRGRVPATFHVIFLHGWAPHETQPRPLRPGSARMRLADALGTQERPAGDKTSPRNGDHA